MQSFAQYFLTRELADETMMSESSDHIKKKHVSHFYEKFPNVQYEDVEDAFEEAKEKLPLLHLGTDHLWGERAPW